MQGSAGKRPDAIVTDGLQAYKTAIPNEFYDKNVERLNGTFRERAKVQRGLYSNETAEDFSEASRVYYNFLRPHMSLDGRTPAQAAGIELNLGLNRWMSMIEQTVKS